MFKLFIILIYSIMTDSNQIHFFLDETEEVSKIVFQTPEYTQYAVTAPVYNDSKKSIVIGFMNISKEIYSLDKNLNTIPGVTNAVYQYSINWANITNIPGVSAFSIIPGDKVVSNGSTEETGTYTGAVDDVNSSGNFLNYAGIVVKIKDVTNISQYTLIYGASSLSPPISFPEKSKIQKVQKFLDANNASSKAPFSAVTFGNAFTGQEVFIGSGNAGSKGEPVSPDMYWRWASNTKMLGSLSIAAALEDGIINSLDELVYKYIPEFSRITQYVSDSTPGVGSDAYGTPKYNMVLTTPPLNPDGTNLGQSITIRMLLNCSTGLAYTFPGIGNSRNNFVTPFQNTKSGQNFIAYLQNIENNPDPWADINTAAYVNVKNVTYTKLIIDRVTKFPLLVKPGTSNVYDHGISFINAVIGKALQMKGINQTCGDYIKSRIFTPLGMTTTWLNSGSLDPPSDALSKLTNGFFVRQNYPNGYTDPQSRGPLVKNGIVYSVFDSVTDGDGMKNQMLDICLQKHEPYDILAGGASGSACGTMTDFCKLLKLIINKGYDTSSNTRILSEQSIEWMLAPIYTLERLSLGLSLPNTGLLNLLNPAATWCGGFQKFMENKELPFAIGPNTYQWGGYFGTSCYFDTKTGNYSISGTQASAASWKVNPTDAPFQPDAYKIWRLLTG